MLDMLQAASTILFLQEWTLASRSLAWLNLNNINRKPQEGHQKSDIRNPWDVNRMSTHHETSITWRGSLHHGHRGPAKVYGPRPQPNFWGWWIIVYPDEVFWMIRLPFATGVFFGCISTWMKRALQASCSVSASVSPRCGRFHEPRIRTKPAWNSGRWSPLVLWSGRISGSPLPGGSASGRLEL